MKRTKALVLFSGGLDSMLAVKLLQIQGIEVDGVCFVSNFFGCENAKKAAKYLGIKLIVIDISKKLLEIVKNPPSGYGKHLNPCLDCHALMVKSAVVKIMADKKGWKYDIIATGEVLGQRPFSQTKEALSRVERLAGREILRPLSAKRLPETEYEKQGLVNRGRLLNISGRSRKRQMELAQKYKLKDYSTPAGGCLLTDSEFSHRLMKMLDYWSNCSVNDVELLKHGRIFWLKEQKKQNIVKETNYVLIVVGRHKEDNDNLQRLARKGDITLELEEIVGPLTVVRIFNFQFSIFKQFSIINLQIPEELKMSELKLGEEKSIKEILGIAAILTGYYATKARGKKVKLKVVAATGGV